MAFPTTFPTLLRYYPNEQVSRPCSCDCRRCPRRLWQERSSSRCTGCCTGSCSSRRRGRERRSFWRRCRRRWRSIGRCRCNGRRQGRCGCCQGRRRRRCRSGQEALTIAGPWPAIVKSHLAVAFLLASLRPPAKVSHRPGSPRRFDARPIRVRAREQPVPVPAGCSGRSGARPPRSPAVDAAPLQR